MNGENNVNNKIILDEVGYILDTCLVLLGKEHQTHPNTKMDVVTKDYIESIAESANKAYNLVKNFNIEKDSKNG